MFRRNQIVLLAHDNQRGSIVGGDVKQRRKFAGILDRQIQRRKISIRRQGFRGAPDHHAQVRWRNKSDNGRHAAGNALQFVFGARRAIVARRSKQQRQMPSGAHPHGANPFGIDAISRGVLASIARRQPHIGRDLRDGIARAAAVANRHQGIALVQIWLKQRLGLFGRSPWRKPAAADHEQDRRAICRFFRLIDVHGQRQSVLVAIYDIRLDSDRRACLGANGRENTATCQGDRQKNMRLHAADLFLSILRSGRRNARGRRGHYSVASPSGPAPASSLSISSYSSPLSSSSRSMRAMLESLSPGATSMIFTPWVARCISRKSETL
ncbi:MAG: hypothetical protein BWZ10_02376 [candidate division BRC1 bacterium ADurb.BinA364]|nr:MAG: hypothetical protein BWZ10_02376 [candidate division BRC1 bacterium ADurb.BinA364]